MVALDLWKLKLQLRTSVVFCCVVALASVASGDQITEALAANIRTARASLPAISGKLMARVSYVGRSSPNISNPSIRFMEVEGDYQWWIHGGQWEIVKQASLSPNSENVSRRIRVKRSYEGRVLEYEVFDRSDFTIYASYGNLNTKESQPALSPMLGRRFSSQYIDELILSLESTSIYRAGSQHDSAFIVKGIRKGTYEVSIFLRIEPSLGYLATEAYTVRGNSKFGYVIKTTKRVGNSWFPKAAIYLSGDYQGESLLDGQSTYLSFEDQKYFTGPSSMEVPSLPAGTIIGSEENRLYRANGNGGLDYWGQQGRRRASTIGWGPAFVISGAVLLLAVLSWVFFRRPR